MTNNNKEYLEKFEQRVGNMLANYLRERKRIDGNNLVGGAMGCELTSLMPDIEELWQKISIAYIPDGVREYNGYPLVSLGWMMYIGMAVAHIWDSDEWEKFSKIDDQYVSLRDQRGFDCMDEAIREDVLCLTGDAYKAEESLVGNCAQMVKNLLSHEQIEPSTPLAFHAYVCCIHQLYLYGAASELHRLGYKLSKMQQ